MSKLFDGYRFMEFSVTTPLNLEQVEEHLAQTRKQGYALSSGQMDYNVLTCSFPIFDSKANVTASLSVVGQQHRFETPEVLDHCIRTLSGYAQKISLALGCPAELVRTKYIV